VLVYPFTEKSLSDSSIIRSFNVAVSFIIQTDRSPFYDMFPDESMIFLADIVRCVL
jgi:hypothetical protein